MEVNTDDIKAEEEGERGWGAFKAVRGAQPRPFLCSPPIEFGGTGKAWALTLEMSHTIALLIVQRHQLIPLLQHINI